MAQHQGISRQACALLHVKNWCAAQALLAQTERQRNLMSEIFRQSIMDDKLMAKIAALYSPEVWTTLTEQTLLDLVPDLKSWNGLERYVLPLCAFLNSTAEEVRTEHLVKLRMEAEARRPFPLLELPNDIRIRIYDVIVTQMLSSERSSLRGRPFIQTHSDAMEGWPRDFLVFPLAQVNKQLRIEFLPRWHRVVELNFDVTGTQYDPDLIDEWIEDFGPSRVPLTRSFAFEFGDDIVRLELRGCPSETVFGRRRLHHEQNQTQQPTDNGTGLKERYRMSSPDAWMPKRQKARALREADFELKSQRLIEKVLMEGTDGHVNMSIQGVNRIIVYLRQRAVPKPEMEPFEEDLMDEEDCLMM